MPDRPSIANLVQTILSLRQLDIQNRAQQTAEARAAVEKQATESSMLNTLISFGSNLKNPKEAFEPHIAELAKHFGYSEPMMRTITENILPSVPTQVAGMAQEGAGAVDPSVVASHALAGALPGDVRRSQFRATLYGPESGELGQIAQRGEAGGLNEQQQYMLGLFQKLGLPEQVQAAGVQAGTRESAAQASQTQLGGKQLELSRQQLMEHAIEVRTEATLRMQELMAKYQAAQTDTERQRLQMLLEATQAQMKLYELSNLTKATATDKGLTQLIQSHNALEGVLKGLDPTYKPFILGPGQSMHAKGFLEQFTK